MDGQYWKGDRTMSTNEWLLTSDFWQFLEPWHGRWYEYEIFIASCTDNIYDLENERSLLGDMIDHVGIYGSKVAEGLSAFNAGLVFITQHQDITSSWNPSLWKARTCFPCMSHILLESLQCPFYPMKHAHGFVVLCFVVVILWVLYDLFLNISSLPLGQSCVGGAWTVCFMVKSLI